MADVIDIAQEIDRHRKRLLDLTTNNRLLAYRKSRTRTLQIVDELPDQIFARLVASGKEFSFLPTLEEDRIEFEPNVWELPESNGPRRKEHFDSSLQTGLSEERLDKVLKTMRTDAITAIQETGVNLLYLALGLLEWFEDKNSNRTLLAPLILVPVKIDRNFDSRSHRWRYMITHSGEEVQSNLCLQKRMEQDFGIQIPDWTDELTPEQYFESLSEVVEDQERWKVRREALIGFFSFRKLLMYLDLDPKKWTGEHSLDNNAVLRQIVSGSSLDSGAPVFLDDYEIDGNPKAEAIKLVTDADSSQHSALCDIMDGKNLVIEGPPGTGKSQTITNAIAAALAAGKTVLFVSEKLAALEVVRHNLEKLGLAAFCLELHSEGAKPQKVFANLLQRLALHCSAPEEIEQKRRQLQLAKKRLQDYLAVCRQPVGPRNETVYQIFWRVVEFRTRNVPFLRTATISTDLSPEAFDLRLEVLKELGKHVAEVGLPNSHAWFGFSTTRVYPHNTDDLAISLADLTVQAKALADSLTMAATEVPSRPCELLEHCQLLSTQTLSQLHPPPEMDMTLARHLQTKSDRDTALELAKDLQDLANAEQTSTGHLLTSVAESRAAADDLSDLLQNKIPKPLCDLSLQSVQKLTAALENICTLLGNGEAHRGTLADLGHEKPQSVRELRASIERHRLVMHAVVQSPTDLVPELFMSWTEQRFVEAAERQKRLVERQSSLAIRFEISDAPAVEDLQHHRRVLRKSAGSLLRLFDREYRSTRRNMRTFLRPKAKATCVQMADDLQELEHWLVDRQQFSKDAVFVKHFGPVFKGFESDWERLETLIRWAKTVKQFGLGYAEATRLISSRNAHSAPPDPNDLNNFVNALLKEVADSGAADALIDSSHSAQTVMFDTLKARAAMLLEVLRRVLLLSGSFSFETTSTLRQVSQVVDAVALATSLREAVTGNPSYIRLCGNKNPLDFKSADVRTAIQWTGTLAQMNLPKTVLVWLSEELTRRPQQLASILTQLRTLVDQVNQQRVSLSTFGVAAEEFLCLGQDAEDITCQKTLARLVAHLSEVQSWSIFSRALARADELGLAAFCEAIVTGGLNSSNLVESFEQTFHERLAQQLVLDNPDLANFSRQRLETARADLQRLDQELIALNRREIAVETASRRPPLGITSGRVAELTELGLIHREVQKQKRHCKIRDLVRRAGRAVQALKPCFMMSPLSVAHFLPPGELKFDIVLMDEASQIRPEDALGTVVRAKQLVVVGDPKQLPPTSFFDRIADDEVQEDEETLLDDTESILEVSMKAFANVRRLKWHYRSHHESLIAFSNEKFYDNDLVVFPSPTRGAGQLGLHFHFVEGGTFVGGCNPIEADQVARAIVEHAKRSPDQTLGVGAFNLLQREAIQDRLDSICGEDSAGREAVGKLLEAADPLFIKNLENLQGDERDVIFISYTYGLDPASGKVMNRFGPMNSQHGWRRLNVLVTRARRRVEVYSSMQPEQILGGPERGRGPNSMRDYLEFAKTGLLADHGARSGREPDSPFEVAVASVVRRLGFAAVPQVGVAGYFIDVGVLLPGSNDEFLLGIECDGAAYHSAKSARDRDRLREEVLCKRGWKLHRIWSTDWYMNQHAEENRLEWIIKKTLSANLRD